MSEPDETKPEEIPAYYGIYEARNYGRDGAFDFRLLVKCTEQQAEKITEDMNHARKWWDGRPTGSLGTERFFVLHRLHNVFESYEEFQAAFDAKMKAEREAAMESRVWRSL